MILRSCRWLIVSAVGFGPIALAAASMEPPGAAVPRPVIHHRNPDVTLRTTIFVCGASERRFTVRYGVAGFEEFASASRDGVEADIVDLRAVTRALRRLDGVSYIYTRCAEPHDQLEVFGSCQRRPVHLYLQWTGTHFWVSPIFYDDRRPPPEPAPCGQAAR